MVEVGQRNLLAPELVESAEAAKVRARQLLESAPNLKVEIWNEAETWQVVAPPGIAAWCEYPEH
jgi:hypothetical protein